MKRVSVILSCFIFLYGVFFMTAQTSAQTAVKDQSTIKLDTFTPTIHPTATPTTQPSKTQSPGNSDGDVFDLPQGSQVSGCPSPALRLRVPGTTYQHLKQQFSCFKPTMVVVHWSAAWTTAQATFDVLNNRNRSCQFALDRNKTFQMLDFYPKVVQRGWCAGGKYNDLSINFEISGVYFDEVITNPGHSRYQDLTIKSDKTVALICWSLKQYGIPTSEVYGHYQIMVGKQDPGPKYLAYIKKRVQNECK